jgi:hypothetical protein
MENNTESVSYTAERISEKLESEGCHISVDAVEDVLSLSAAVNSYAKHCGPSAIQCAEDDLLGQALEALRECSHELGRLCEQRPDGTMNCDMLILGKAQTVLARSASGQPD